MLLKETFWWQLKSRAQINFSKHLGGGCNCDQRFNKMEEQMRMMMERIHMLEAKDAAGGVNIDGIPFMSEADILS